MTKILETRFCRLSEMRSERLARFHSGFSASARTLGGAQVVNCLRRGAMCFEALAARVGLSQDALAQFLAELHADRIVTWLPQCADEAIHLTEAGMAELSVYLQAASEVQRDGNVIAFGDLASTLLGLDSTRVSECDPIEERAVFCLTHYYRELDRRFAGGFSVERSRDPGRAELVRPLGCFLVAELDQTPIGCIALKRASSAVAEIKRLWVAEFVRSAGVGKRLMGRAEDIALELGVKVLRLDTNAALAEAATMYRATGWTEIPRINDDPYANFFFEKKI